MTEFTPQIAGNLRRDAVIEAYRLLIDDSDTLTLVGLRHVRSRLAQANEFDWTPALDELRLDTDCRLAERMGCPLDHLPGYDL